MEITSAQIKAKLLEEDDFGFEIRVGAVFSQVARKFPSINSESTQMAIADHGGTYMDQATGKPRQFDYRNRIYKTTHRRETHWNVALAVECKNLNRKGPLVVCGRRRTIEECYHTFQETIYNPTAPAGVSSSLKIAKKEASIYKQNEFVGKSLFRLDQRGNKDSDSDIYERYAQALASSFDLTLQKCRSSKFMPSGECQDLLRVIPVIVIPDEALWIAEYNPTGNLIADPSQVEECEFFVERRFDAPQLDRTYGFVISHVHFVTLTGFSNFLGRFYENQAMDRHFPYVG